MSVSFWREMSKGEQATFRACFGGWALDGMDFQLYSFVIPTLIAGWHLTKAQAGTLRPRPCSPRRWADGWRA